MGSSEEGKRRIDMYRKLDCECGHGYDCHIDEKFCGKGICDCKAYDPAGHNPELENVLCPRCRLARLEKPSEKTYMCPACQYVMLESQVLRLVG